MLKSFVEIPYRPTDTFNYDFSNQQNLTRTGFKPELFQRNKKKMQLRGKVAKTTSRKKQSKKSQT